MGRFTFICCLGVAVLMYLLEGRTMADPPQPTQDLGTLDTFDIPVTTPKPMVQIIVGKMKTEYQPENDLESFLDRIVETIHGPAFDPTTHTKTEDGSTGRSKLGEEFNGI